MLNSLELGLTCIRLLCKAAAPTRSLRLQKPNSEEENQVRNVAHLVVHLPSIHKVLVSIPRTTLKNLVQWYIHVILTFRKWRQEDKQFKVMLGHMVSLRTIWAI